MARLSIEEADRLQRLTPPFPPASEDPQEQCPGPTNWHRPHARAWDRGDLESYCTWCHVKIERRFMDPTWRSGEARPWNEDQRYLNTRRLQMEGEGD